MGRRQPEQSEQPHTCLSVPWYLHDETTEKQTCRNFSGKHCTGKMVTMRPASKAGIDAPGSCLGGASMFTNTSIRNGATLGKI